MIHLKRLGIGLVVVALVGTFVHLILNSVDAAYIFIGCLFIALSYVIGSLLEQLFNK